MTEQFRDIPGSTGIPRASETFANVEAIRSLGSFGVKVAICCGRAERGRGSWRMHGEIEWNGSSTRKLGSHLSR